MNEPQSIDVICERLDRAKERLGEAERCRERAMWVSIYEKNLQLYKQRMNGYDEGMKYLVYRLWLLTNIDVEDRT